MSRYSGRGLLLGMLVVFTACESATGPVSGLSGARRRWLAFAPTDYTFETRSTTAWFPPGNFQRVTVRGGKVIPSVDVVTGAPRAPEYQVTLAGLWKIIDDGGFEYAPLAEVRFDKRGVPVRLMFGTVANDGGVLYEVRDVRER